jgi:SAM-dependent methyltransferase
MAVTLDDLRFLQSDSGERLLERLADADLSDANALHLVTALRKDFSARQVSAVVEMARLRVKAVDKFGDSAARMFFTRDALEQASDPHVRRWRASRVAPMQRVIDACCGIGADSLAYAAAGADVLGLDIDPVRVEMARHNAVQLELPARFDVSDVTIDPRLIHAGDTDLIFFDPARRNAEGGRIFDVEQYQPPLSTMLKWGDPGLILVKLSPGVQLDQLRQYGRGSVTFCSVVGDLKEAILALPRVDSGGEEVRCDAVLFDHGRALQWERQLGTTASIGAPHGYLCEPDPALIRAGFVQDIAVRCGGALLDETIAYFTCDAPPVDPDLRAWMKVWRVRDWMPFNVKRIREYCRQRGIGAVTVKKRGTAVTPEVIIPQLKLRGDNRATLVLTRQAGAQIAILCDDMPEK